MAFFYVVTNKWVIYNSRSLNIQFENSNKQFNLVLFLNFVAKIHNYYNGAT